MTFDLAALKRRNRAITDAHAPAIEAMFQRCRASDPQAWVSEYVEAAVNVMRPAKVPLSPAMGQGLLESGWGKSSVLFGIKARKRDVDAGKAVERMTKECINGKWITCPAFFFKDTSMAGEFDHYLDLVRRVHPNFAKFYPASREDYLRYIMRPGRAYATDDDPTTPEIEYVEKVLGVVRTAGLEIFDKFEMYYPTP